MFLKPRTLFLMFILTCQASFLTADSSSSSSTSSSTDSKKSTPTTSNAIQSKAQVEQYTDSDLDPSSGPCACKKDTAAKKCLCKSDSTTGADVTPCACEKGKTHKNCPCKSKPSTGTDKAGKKTL